MKVMVNGSQMHYGRGFVSYRPLLSEPGERFQYREGLSALLPFNDLGYDHDSYLPITNGEEVCIMTQSQWPKIFIDPGQSMGGEMEFPFFYGANWFRIPNRDWVANPSAVDCGATDSDGNPVANMLNGTAFDVSHGPYGVRAHHAGVVHSSSLAPLKHANGADDPVTIQVFLWATDVKFSVPTSVPHPSIPDVSGSRTASFEPHARSVYVPNFLGDLAHSSSPDIAGRLEMGSSSLETDESTVGLGLGDEMSIKALAQRECWLDRFTWPVNVPAETPLWSCRVTPQYFKRQTAPGNSNIARGVVALQPTPSAYAALPFGYWRGSMKYRVQVVASNLHRGRLRIVYDPLADIHARDNVNNYPEALMNQQYSRTIDIAGDSGRDFCFEVGYMQETPYLALLPLEAQGPTSAFDVNYDWENYGSEVPTPATGRVGPTQTTNGQITIYVLNRLAIPATGPAINNDVTVNVFVSAGADMDFQMPTSRAVNMLSFVDPTGFPINYRNDQIPQSLGNEAARRAAVFQKREKKEPKKREKPERGETANFEPHMDAGDSAAMGATEMENVPEEPPTKAWMGDCSQPAATMAAVTFGENIQSFTELMGRWQVYNREIYTRTDTPIDSETRGDDEYTILTVYPDFPPFPGPAPISEKWGTLTSYPGASFLTQGPFLAGTSEPDFPGDLCGNAALNIAPAGKYFLNAPVNSPVPNPDVNYLDSARLLKVNPGEMTMMHYVTRMFIGRKGSIRNKYVLDGDTASNLSAGTRIMSVKRLPDSGIVSGNTYFDKDNSCQTIADSVDVLNAMPAYGGFWSQASCKVENSSNAAGTPRSVPNIVKAQALNGNIQTGTSNIAAPNWLSLRRYPFSPNYVSTGNAGETVTKSDLMMGSTYDGAHVTTSLQQPVIEVEIPFYVNSRFIKNDLVMNNTRGVQAHLLKYESHLSKQTEDDSIEEAGTITYVERHVKPGSDFALYYLANVPHIVLNGNLRYQTVYGINLEGFLGYASYSSLRYRVASNQEASAYREEGVTPIPAGTSSVNTYPQDIYFYNANITDQIYPLNQPSSSF